MQRKNGNLTEVIAGLTTFFTMAYIIFLHPAILSDTGMDKNALIIVTCIVTAVSTIATGLIAKVPIAMAPGLGLNTFFAYSFDHFYLGGYYSFVHLIAKEAPKDAIENYYGYSFPVFRRRLNYEVRVKSTLHNAGLLIGRRIEFNHSRLSLALELSFAKTFFSNSYVETDAGKELPNLSEQVDDELSDYYLRYGYLPSLNVFLFYSF